MRRWATALLWLSAAACARAPEAPPDAGAIDARSLVEVVLDARGELEVPRYRAQLRADLAAAWARTGSAARARRELATALEEARALSPTDDRDRALVYAARVARAVGQADEAARVLTELRSPEDRAELAADVAIDQAAALAIPVGSGRDRALARLAHEAVGRGDIDRAAALAARIEDGSLRAPVMGAMCASMLRNGRAVDAKRMVAELDGLARSEAHAALAMDAARKGDLRLADRWAEAIESEPLRARTLGALAMSRPAASLERRRWAAKALQTALDVQSTDLRHAAIEALVRVFVDARDALGADTIMGTALAAPVRGRPSATALDTSGAARVRALIAAGYAAEGDAASAGRVAKAIEDPVVASDAWAAIARASVRAGSREAALAAAARIVPDELRMPVIAEIAVAPGPAPTSATRAALASALTRRPR